MLSRGGTRLLPTRSLLVPNAAPRGLHLFASSPSWCFQQHQPLRRGTLHLQPTSTCPSPLARIDTSRSFSSSSSSSSSSSDGSAKPTPAPDSASSAVPKKTVWVRIIEGSSPVMSAYLRLIRFHQPNGTVLLFLPCLWGTTLAMATSNAGPAGVSGAAAVLAALPPLDLVSLFLFGAFVMRSAGCIINDMWDMHFDKDVARTKLRPIACGEISQQRAFGYLTLHMTGGLFVVLCLNNYALGVALPSVLLAASYPLAKRYTHFPQLVLGMAYNWGVLVGYAAVTESMNWSAVLPVYAAGVCWTLLYDTIYGHQDKKDDIKIGVKSTALYFGDSKASLYGFGVASAGLLGAGGWMIGYGLPYFVGLGFATAYQCYVVHRSDLDNPTSCMQGFVASRWFAIIMTVAMILGNFYPAALS